MSVLSKGIGLATDVGAGFMSGITPYLCIAAFVAGGAAVGLPLHAWMAKDVRVAEANQRAAEHDLKSVTEQRQMAKEDVDRYLVAYRETKQMLDERNAEVEQGRADLARTEALLDTAINVTSAEAKELKAKLKKMEDRADAHPDEVRDLGPIVDGTAELLNGRPR